MNNYQFFLKLKTELEISGRGVLLTVTDSAASSPGRKGFKMAVFPGRKIIGSIGGGILEKNLIDEMLKHLAVGQTIMPVKEAEINEFREYHHGDKYPGKKSGMICSGSQSIMINSLNSDSVKIFNELINSYDTKQPMFLELSENGISLNNKDEGSVLGNRYSERIGLMDTAYIVGGGHVGLAVSKQMKLLGFGVIVFDKREDISTIEENVFADKIIKVSARRINEFILEGENSFVIIVSHNHHEDLDAMISVLEKDVKYIGVMGSPQKINTLMQEAEKTGCSKEKLIKVNAPIGININSRTPEEIAVSIAAKIIEIKNS